ncbi:unnamed protein product, partial [Mesorhabditis belari]|uniref:BTB domain-containing protein n=1 Tax=Mesorhabditis belari TaxID=2138241 RepID=A0AAF3FGK4_9BILA
MMRMGQQPNNNGKSSATVSVDQRLWPLFNDLLIIAGNDQTCSGSLSQSSVEDLTFVVRSLCRRVANQQLKEKCISMIGGANETYIAPLALNCGPENFGKPGDVYRSPILTLQEFNWRFIVEAKTANECVAFMEVDPVSPNTVWSVTARFQLNINNISFESGDVEFSFNSNRHAIPWRNTLQHGLIPRAPMRSPLKVQVSKVGVRALPIPDFHTVTPDDANTAVYVEGKPVPVNFQLLAYHSPALRGASVVDGKTQLPGAIQHSHFRTFLENLFNNAPVNASNVSTLLDVSSSLQCVLVRERCEAFLIHTTELPFPVKLDLATRYKLAIAQGYCLSVIRNRKEVEEARNDPEFEKMCDLAKMAFAMKEKTLSGNSNKPVVPIISTPVQQQQQPPAPTAAQAFKPEPILQQQQNQPASQMGDAKIPSLFALSSQQQGNNMGSPMALMPQGQMGGGFGGGQRPGIQGQGGPGQGQGMMGGGQGQGMMGGGQGQGMMGGGPGPMQGMMGGPGMQGIMGAGPGQMGMMDGPRPMGMMDGPRPMGMMGGMGGPMMGGPKPLMGGPMQMGGGMQGRMGPGGPRPGMGMMRGGMKGSPAKGGKPQNQNNMRGVGQGGVKKPLKKGSGGRAVKT